jgi:hypothetical protein
MLMTFIPLGLAPIAALAETCGDYPLTQAQSDYLAMQSLDIAVPEGEVPVIVRCDVDGNNVIDRNDLAIIREYRGEVPAHPDDPMDWDGNHVIHGRDVGGCASSCTSTGCSAQEQAEEEGLLAAQGQGDNAIVGDPAACFQVEDFDGDGSEDFFGLYDYTGSDTRANDWTLQLVILTEDNFGNVQHVLYPYSGRVTSGDLDNHLSLQPAGVIDLNPGTVTIDEPGVVSYRNGVPKVLYYYDNGTLAQAFYGIVD